MTTTILNTKISEVENKRPDISNLVTTTILNSKISEVENKIPDHAKYITTQEFNNLAAANFAARLKQVDLLNKTDFDDKLTSFNKRITSNKTKHLEVQKKLNSLITNVYFTSNDGSQNMFIHQPTFNVLELKNDKSTEYIISWKSKGLYNSKLIALYGCFFT